MRYYKFSSYLKEQFGCRVHKVSIDAGFSCPNKDGRFSRDGCIFCDNRGFSFNTRITPKPVEIQIEEGMKIGKIRFKAEKFIVYFQAYTNTYAPLEVLKEKYRVVKKFNSIVGIAIGTRPDTVDEEILNLIESYSREYEVWIEYGLQSIHDKTLKLINRNHTYRDFLKAVEATRDRNIKICAHVILGLPGESEEEILTTAKELGKFRLDGVKIHPLHIIKGTKLEGLYREGEYKPFGLDEYVGVLVKFLEYLCPDTVIQRITADCYRQLLVAPEWILKKSLLLQRIEKRLEEKNTFQGRLFQNG
ncbi:MAG TPA: TIGR01212 family radical SAM protein [Candidatus Omnitrophica bacterium]|nr:TIGR01212 family radical SAM protein [Candidatus Omnitrophota bacterium]